MHRWLITHSLLSSWLYCLRDNPYETADDECDEGKLTKLDEFMLTLRREPTPTSDAMRRGIDFEDLVTSVVHGYGDTSNRWYEAAAVVAKVISGGILQHRAKKEVDVQGTSLLLYGRFDALRAGVVYDIKYSGSYEAGKFYDSTQHPMYLEIVPEATRFTYLISNGSNVWSETYMREETPSIMSTIANFFDWLEIHSLMDLYKEKWLAL